MNTLKGIGRLALEKLFNSARFRPQDPEAGFDIKFSETDYNLNEPMEDCYIRDHETGYRAGQNYMVWGIELGLKRILPDGGKSFMDTIISQTAPFSPLPSHLIVHEWSRSDHQQDESYVVSRLSDPQDRTLRKLLQEKSPTALV